MKYIEIVLATHGENILWASGLENIVTEYSTKEQALVPSLYHKEKSGMSLALRDFRGINHNGSSGIDDFLRCLREVVGLAKTFHYEIGEILNEQPYPADPNLRVLKGHKIVKVENDKNLCEAKHFLTHIIQNYDSLAETTIFLQGHPFDHIKNLYVEIIRTLGQDFSCLPSAKKKKLGDSGHDLMARQFGEVITKKKIESSYWSAGACFMASKNAILANPLSWYENVLKEAKDFKDSKYALERIWSVVINPNEDWS